MKARHIISFLITLLFASMSYAYQEIDFIKEIGTADRKAKQRLLSEPRAVTVAGEKIYVADTDAHRVLVLDFEGKILLAWGSKGDRPGQFRSPAGIAVDEHGTIFVSDTGNNRIQAFDPEGRLVRLFGEKGSGPRQFSEPAGLAARHNLLYIADRGNSRVQVLSTDGIYISMIQIKDKKSEMKEPVAVALDLTNKVYVLDGEDNKVRIFDCNGVQLDQFGVEGRGTDGFDEPQGLAVDANGSIYVADTGNYKLKKFDPQGRLVASFGCEGEGPGQFRELAGVAAGRDGRIYALDARRQTLQIFTCQVDGCSPLEPASPPAGIQLVKETPGEVSALAVSKGVWVLSGDSLMPLGEQGRKIGSRGSEPGKFKNPQGLAADAAGNFWVADTGNDRVQKISPEGVLLQVIGKAGSREGQFDEPSGIAVSQKGNVYVADTGNERVQVFSSKGVFLGMFGKPGESVGQFGELVDIAVDASEHLYIVDRGNNRIAKYSSTGTLIWEAGRAGTLAGEFQEPANILVSPDNEVFVLDAGNARVQVFDGNGRFIRAFGCKGKGLGEFRSPRGIALEDGVRLFVGDRGNGRVQLFTLLHTPSIPQGLSAQAQPNEIQVSWKNNTESYLGEYAVYRSESEKGPFSLAGSSTESFYHDKNLPSNKGYFYRVSAKARDGHESALSGPVSATTPKLVPETPKKVRVEAQEKQITLSWLPNIEPFVDHYRIYRTTQMSSGFELLGRADNTMFVDTPLADETFYYYQVTAVGKEGDESSPCEVVFASTPRAADTLPPIEIAHVEADRVFASAYKYYESHSIGKAVIRNNTDNEYQKVKVSFAVKEFMDFPTELVIETLGAKQQVELELKPVFSNRILDVTENTPVQSELALTYYIDGEAKTVTRSFPVIIYERHAMVWDRKEKLGAFVTPKDPPVADFSRSVIRSYVDAYPNLHPALVSARTLYAALGVLGTKYIVDPTSPFRDFSENSGNVDYLQYPRDTLARKSGDCDDLSVLFAALLENIGIGTAFVDVPGHVFVMFNTGVKEKDRSTLGFPEQQVILHEGYVWVPVEMTMVGSPFTKAWQRGAQEFLDWHARGSTEIVTTQNAWESFSPVTLPRAEARSVAVGRDEIEALFREELEGLAAQRLANLSAEYLERIRKNAADTEALGQLGILYAENGLHAEALEQFQKILAADKHNAAALCNIGNINFLQERFEDARIAYQASLGAAPQDPGTMTNLARTLVRLGRKEEARKQFQAAAALDPRVARQYPDMATVLDGRK